MRPGDEIRVLPRDTRSSQAHRHRRRRLDAAVAGQAVTLTLADEVDIGRGDMLAAADEPRECGPVRGDVLWMADEQMFRGRNYLMRIGTQLATATITALKHKLNVNTLEHVAARRSSSTRSASSISADRPVAFDAYARTATPAASSSSTASPTRPSAPA